MRRFTFGLIVLAMMSQFACSGGPASLLEDGAIAMGSLSDEQLDTELIDRGKASLETFLDRHTNNADADSARFMLATLQEVGGLHIDAAQNYLELLRRHPESRFCAKSLILAGHIYEAIPDYARAHAAYDRLIRDYPDHEFVAGGSAKWLLDNLGRSAEEWPVPFDSVDSDADRSE